jgi:deazaflavin-dependent oxidoreductase (nitroreductase family)
VFNAMFRRLGRQKWFSEMGRVVVPVDRYIGRVSRGRINVLAIIGMKSLMLTTTGRRSGQPRCQPLLYVPDGDAYVVVGSNWGGPKHPGWSANLLADPSATVDVRGRRIPVRAVLAKGAERDRLWELVQQTWPAYENYAARTDRTIRLFRLVPAETATRGG